MHVRATLVTPTLPMGTDSRTNCTTSTQGQGMSPVPRPHPQEGVLEAAPGSWLWPKHIPGHCSHLGLTEDLSHFFKYINLKKKIFFSKILQFFLYLIFNKSIKVTYLHVAMYLISIPIRKKWQFLKRKTIGNWAHYLLSLQNALTLSSFSQFSHCPSPMFKMSSYAHNGTGYNATTCYVIAPG